jgi:transcriptional regulator with XRE-family HTH domain
MVAIQLVTNEEALVFHNRRMAARRIELGLMQAEVAAKAGMKQGQWTRYEVGINAPGSDALVRIARALECSADYLLGLSSDIGGSGSLPPDERAVLDDYRVERDNAKSAIVDKRLGKFKEKYFSLVERAIAFLESQSEIKDTNNEV